jgi:hypothetical protein
MLSRGPGESYSDVILSLHAPVDVSLHAHPMVSFRLHDGWNGGGQGKPEGRAASPLEQAAEQPRYSLQTRERV